MSPLTSGPTVADLLQARDFSAQERRVARALLADYPRAGLGSAAALAQAAGVSTPTVVRFAQTLGFAGYTGLQAALLDEVSERAASPAAQYAARLARHPGRAGHWLADGIAAAQGALAGLASIPDAELARAVQLIGDPKLGVSAFGGRYSHMVARYLTLYLEQIRPGVRVQPSETLPPGEFIDASKRDLYVVYDFRRYQSSTIRQATALKEAGAVIICVTDPWLSPIARLAEVVLPVSVASATPFDSDVAAFALTELIAGAVLEEAGPTALKRLQRWDAADAGDALESRYLGGDTA
jgi:DNA-binding MurR/RpiR family transcriptional regulator